MPQRARHDRDVLGTEDTLQSVITPFETDNAITEILAKRFRSKK